MKNKTSSSNITSCDTCKKKKKCMYFYSKIKPPGLKCWEGWL
jgi:hypothetical protein